MTLTDVIREYEKQQRSRAWGGLRALSGFDFQLRCHLAEFVEHLVSSNGVLDAGHDFAHGLEALSDFTVAARDDLVCVQAKRTLTTTSVAQAAVEFATIADFLWNSSASGAAAVRPRFRVVGNRSDLTADWSWDAVTLPAKGLSKRPELQQVWLSLVEEQRLDPPQVEPDPWWRVIAATFQRLDKSFEFARQALDLCLRRHDSTAERVRDDIAELFRKHLSPKPLKSFQAVVESDFALDPDDRLQPLRVGYRPSLALVRNRQFLTRAVHVRNAIKSLDELLLNQGYGNVTGLPVLWISGPSGCGKSVLLLQVLESLVKSGLSAVWLEDDARRVVPLLRAFCAERDAESADLPGFIFIDDLYSPTNQQRIDLTELETIVGDRPFDLWPVIVTCGPPEFFDRLERESSGSTLHLERWSLPLVQIQPSADGDPAEADLFTAWFQERTGEQPQRGSAFDREQGLMISMAYELRFEDPNAIKPFASRFRDRLRADDLDQTLVLPLALNRLYLLTPADWLKEPDRERLEAINRENDFSILDLGSDGEFLRLTHPHISDEVYRAIRYSATPRAFANDLAEAMRRAMASNVKTLRLLLRALSSADPRITERLDDVDLQRLAELVTVDWKRSDVESRLRASEVADICTSWACWHAQNPELQLEQRLGRSLFVAARTALRTSGSAWSFLWQRLHTVFPGHVGLTTDAVEWLHEPASEQSKGWSYVWEDVWNQRLLPGLPFDERTLFLCARQWLRRNLERGGWPFVWTKLVRSSERDLVTSDELIDLGWQWITQKNSSLQTYDIAHSTSPGWADVWQRLLKHKRFETGPALNDLLNIGFDWIRGREDRRNWSLVWNGLLQAQSLPRATTRNDLLTRGLAWLDEREDRGDWTHVWRVLIKHPTLPHGTTRDDLLTRGLAWLDGREGRGDWNHVWRALLKYPSLPHGTTRDDLLTRGLAWLDGREERGDWNHVWRALLKYPTLPNGTTHDDLLTRGFDCFVGCKDRRTWRHAKALLKTSASIKVRWLQQMETLDGHAWALVWQQTMDIPDLSKAEKDNLVTLGVAWLNRGDNTKDWTFVWQRLARMRRDISREMRAEVLRIGKWWLTLSTSRTRPEWDKLLENWIDAGGCDVEVLFIASEWILQHRSEKQVPPLAAKVLCTTRPPADFDYVAEWLSEWCQRNSESGTSKFVLGIFLTAQGKGWCPAFDTFGWKSLCAWLASQSPTIRRVDEASAATLLKGGRVVGRISHRIPSGYIVELRHPEATAFLPRSQVDLRVPLDWDAFIGLEYEFEITNVSIEDNGWSIKISRRAVLEAEKRALAHSRIVELKTGECVVETVKRIVDFGVFCDLDGVDGLLHRNEMRQGRVRFHAGGFMVGQRLSLVVLSLDVSTQKITLGLKAPWEGPALEIIEGSDVEGTVTNVVEYGAFVEVEPGVFGLLHKSNVTWDTHPKPLLDYLRNGLQLRCRVLRVDPVKKQLELGLKQLQPNPWENVGSELVENSDVDGTVTHFQRDVAFVEVPWGVLGSLHRSNISWDRKPKAPAECLQLGQRLRCRVLRVDAATELLELGLKQLTPNPWATIGATLIVGSDIDGTVTNLVNYGAFITVAAGVEGLLHLSNLSWVKKFGHPQEQLELGQRLRCRILRVNVEKHEVELGLKQLTTNPWEEQIPRQFLVGAWVVGRVAKVTNFGLFVELEPDLHGLLHPTEIPDAPADPKELAQHYEIGQPLRVRILRVDAAEQKISISLKPGDT